MFEALGRLVGGVLRLVFLFVLVAVAARHLAPGTLMEMRRPWETPELIDDEATPRRPSREEEPEELGGVLFRIAEPEPGTALGSAFKVGGGTLWLTANHVIQGCDTVGLDMGLFHAASVTPGHSIPEADVAAMHLLAHVPQSLELAVRTPERGDTGYHMGFPRGRRAVVVSRFMGEAEVTIGARQRSPVFTWVEDQRLPDFSGPLAGISGGPVLDSTGALVGINIAVSQRRGRILTAPPSAIDALLVAEDAVTFSTAAGQAAVPEAAIGPTDQLDPESAAELAQALERAGTMRKVYCRVGG